MAGHPLPPITISILISGSMDIAYVRALVAQIVLTNSNTGSIVQNDFATLKDTLKRPDLVRACIPVQSGHILDAFSALLPSVATKVLSVRRGACRALHKPQFVG
jgi:hypothetical protein